MKSKKTFMALLVALLVFVAVVSVASGHRVEIQQNAPNATHIVRKGRLACLGVASTRARAIFYWTKNGKQVGSKISFACKDSKNSRIKTLVYEHGANDLKVRIKVWDASTGDTTTCTGKQVFAAGHVPSYFAVYCYLDGSAAAFIFAP